MWLGNKNKMKNFNISMLWKILSKVWASKRSNLNITWNYNLAMEELTQMINMLIKRKITDSKICILFFVHYSTINLNWVKLSRKSKSNYLFFFIAAF
jgi:hypothetical protein